MKDLKTNITYKGTKIRIGNEKFELLEDMSRHLLGRGFTKIEIPIIQNQEIFKNKVGEENNNLMFNFQDRGGRNICLAPEYTAVVQQLSRTTFKHDKDVMLFYVQECFRGEKPQRGRYRQFTQLGVEILNPTKLTLSLIDLPILALNLCNMVDGAFSLDRSVKRGLDYYEDGKGFEISCDQLGSSKQVCGGGFYEGGVGFAIGIDRLILLNSKNPTNE